MFVTGESQLKVCLPPAKTEQRTWDIWIVIETEFTKKEKRISEKGVGKRAGQD